MFQYLLGGTIDKRKIIAKHLFGHPKIVQGASAHFWMGASGNGKALNYKQMMDEIEPLRIGDGGGDRFRYIESGLESIAAQPVRYIRLRLRRLVEAYMQPYGTVAVGNVFGSYGIKQAIMLNDSLILGDVMSSPAFWSKLWIYMMHYGSIVLALLYVIFRPSKWRHWLLLSLVIGYFSAVYGFLTVIPRYLFPIMSLYLLLASALIVSRSSRNTNPFVNTNLPRI